MQLLERALNLEEQNVLLRYEGRTIEEVVSLFEAKHLAVERYVLDNHVPTHQPKSRNMSKMLVCVKGN